MLNDRAIPGQAQAALWHRASHLEGPRLKKKKTCTYRQNIRHCMSFFLGKGLDDNNFTVNYELSLSKGLFIHK